MDTPISALAAARSICERSDWSVTNLELQKMLYIAQMMYMGEHNGDKLFNGRFEAWDYGPVEPTVYSRVRSFGSTPIGNVFFGVRSPAGGERATTLESAYDQLSTKTAGQLVNITHWSKGAWARYYHVGGRRIVIPDEAIFQEYKDRVEAFGN